jgi:hypothetical protein
MYEPPGFFLKRTGIFAVLEAVGHRKKPLVTFDRSLLEPVLPPADDVEPKIVYFIRHGKHSFCSLRTHFETSHFVGGRARVAQRGIRGGSPAGSEMEQNQADDGPPVAARCSTDAER